MAIARGAGTEIIRCHLFEDVDNNIEKLIVGVQHHIYTVLSISCYCNVRSGTETGDLQIAGYDANLGDTGAYHKVARISCNAHETFVYSDKFSFNGYEPVDFTGPMDTIAKQDAIADQGNTGTFPTGSQFLHFSTGSSGTTYDLIVTFIDQNNS